jgi:hypothetical protein
MIEYNKEENNPEVKNGVASLYMPAIKRKSNLKYES